MVTGMEQGIRKKINGRVLYNELMRKHTSFRIGGPADILVEPWNLDDLRNCLRLSIDTGMPLLVIGKGTNLLVRDEGVRGMVVNMQSRRLRNIYRDGRAVIATSSVSLKEFVDFCAEEGLTGAEFFSGIPGTVGGAVATNAGARHYMIKKEWHSAGGLVEEIKVMCLNGETRLLGKNDLNFRYKALDLADCVILEVKFLLKEALRDTVFNECRKFLERKKATQDITAASAGCIFKNPPGIDESAAGLIDKCGLKGLRIGGAAVSEIHANFIINTGKASASDVTELMSAVKTKVNDRFGVELVPEIKIV